MPPTMSRMGDVLAGFHAAWEFESDSVLIRYERGIRTPRLFQALGERRIPFEAIETVTLAPGRRGTVVLRAEPRAGADPLTEAAAGQLKESCDPYRLVLPAERETLAEYYADELRARLKPHDGAAERFLVAAPEVPLRFKAYDGKASFDGRTVSFRWFWTGASSAKWKAGDQSFPVADLNGVEWRSPRFSKVIYGCCAGPRRRCLLTRIRRLSCSGWGMGPCTSPLPFAAAVLAAVRSVRTSAVVPAARRGPADIAERIRHLGELHQSGLVTDEEFAVKKAELLAEL